MASIPARRPRGCGTSPTAPPCGPRASARSTPAARSRSRGSAAKHRSPSPARRARRCATPATAAAPRAACTPRPGPTARRSSAPTHPSSTRQKMQTPAPFEYERATSLQGAIAALQAHEDSRILAGGHSLLPMMKLRLATPRRLIDINDLTDLAYIREDGDELAIGALPRHVDLLKSELLLD